MMFWLSNNKRRDLITSESQNYLLVLSKIQQLLIDADYPGHAEIISKSKELLSQGEIDLFIKSINGVDFWGGSGAVWEVGIENDELNVKFEYQIIQLINLMKATGVNNDKLNSIKRYFSS